MTTPSGAISVQDVINEFGLGKPVSFSQFYGLGGATASGPISLGDMRNLSNSVVLRISGGTYSNQIVVAGETYSATDASLTVTAATGTSFSVTRTTGYGIPATGTYSGTSQSFSVASVSSDRTATWAVTAGGMTFYLRITATGSGTGTS